MKPNRPTERLFVDHKDEDERERKAQRQTGKVGQKPKQSRLDQDQFANLPVKRAKKAKQAEFAPAVDHQGKKRAGNSHNCNDDRDRFQSVSDREGAIEDANRFGT